MAPLAVSTSSNTLIKYLHHNLRRQTNAPAKNSIDSPDLSSGAKAGIALGVIIPVILVGLVLFYLYTHNWDLSSIREKLRFRTPSRFVISSPIKWPPKSWHRVESITTKTSSSESRTTDEPPKIDVAVSEREMPGKWWSAEEIAKGGDKASTGRSRFSVVKPPWESQEPKVVKAPRPPSIFTSKTSIYGVERNGEPEVVRPGSRAVKTMSKHISAQFTDFGFGRVATPKTSPRVDDALKAVAEEPKASKRDSKAVVTNLDWQDFEVPR